MKKKRVIALLMAFSMCAGTAMPAYATETGEDAAAITEITSNDEIAETMEETSLDISSYEAQAEAIAEQIEAESAMTYRLDDETLLNVQLYELILLNLIRADYGLDVLAYDTDLANAAVQRAYEAGTYFSHTRPDGREWSTIYDEYGIPSWYLGENLAMGQTSVDDAVASWMNSEGHRANILSSDFQTIGIGVDNSFSMVTWSQLFGGGYTVSSLEFLGMEKRYSVGADLSEQGILVIANYTNGRSAMVPLQDSMISGYDANRLGSQTIRVQMQGASVNVKLEIFDGVKDFVERLYQDILGRKADASGLQAWTDVLRSGSEQGAKVAQGFIDSVEFKNRSLSDKEYLTILYHTFFNRQPDASGLQAWLNVLDSGLTRMHVFRGFAESDEFTKICESYGIERGNANLTAPADQNEGVTKFVARCYRLCLGRREDSAGLNEWCNAILTGRNTAKQAAFGFVFSSEFQNKHLSDTDFIKVMYRVFLDREADASGLSAWGNVLRGGGSREHVFNGFADSPEFREICARYGI